MSILVSEQPYQQATGIQNPENLTSIAGIRLKPLPASLETVAALYDDAALLFEELCFYWEPNAPYTELPFHLQREIDERRWCGAIAQLQVRGLVEVAIGGGS